MRMLLPAWISGVDLKAPIRRKSQPLTRNDILDKTIWLTCASIMHSSARKLSLLDYEQVSFTSGLLLVPLPALSTCVIPTIQTHMKRLGDDSYVSDAFLFSLLSSTNGVGIGSCRPGSLFCVAEMGG